jgi:hypothetical protein
LAATTKTVVLEETDVTTFPPRDTTSFSSASSRNPVNTTYEKTKCKTKTQPKTLHQKEYKRLIIYNEMDCGLFHLMEDFILREVDYSQKYGYSSRAKRYMKRKLNKELAPFIENEENEENENYDDEYDSKYETNENETSESKDMLNNSECESILIPKTRVEICFLISYLSIICTFYGVGAYIITSYQGNCVTPQY